MGRRARNSEAIDTELDDLPRELIWREWMGRVEAVIFASPTPVSRQTLARVVGKDCNLDALIEDIRAELGDRPYELVGVTGGWQHRTRAKYADAIRLANGAGDRSVELSKLENLVVTAIAYFQPITRGDLGAMLGREISRDTLADLRSLGLIANGPRSPRAGAPNTYVTTSAFLSRFGFDSLQDLPDREAIENARLNIASDNGNSGMVDLLEHNVDDFEDQDQTRRPHEKVELASKITLSPGCKVAAPA